MPLDKKTVDTLAGVTTATITTVLLKKGLRNIWLRGTKPLRPGQPRIVGPAFTLRFVPAREAGIFGDILCERIRVREVAGLITDGVIRDLAGVLRTNLPVWCQGTAAPASVAGLTFVGWQMPIACGGVAVFPNDIIVVDDDGAVVIPAALLDEVVEAAVEQEKLEAWIIDEVRSGLPLPGLYPPNAETKARYASFRAAQDKSVD
jgi:regulator of RNase E activity RraA